MPQSYSPNLVVGHFQAPSLPILTKTLSSRCLKVFEVFLFSFFFWFWVNITPHLQCRFSFQHTSRKQFFTGKNNIYSKHALIFFLHEIIESFSSPNNLALSSLCEVHIHIHRLWIPCNVVPTTFKLKMKSSTWGMQPFMQS